MGQIIGFVQPVTFTPDDITLEKVYEFQVWVTVDGKASRVGSNIKRLVVGCPATPYITITLTDPVAEVDSI